MNKRQTVWLIVRLIGVYFCYWGIVSLLSLVGAIYVYVSLPSPNTPANKSPQTIQVNGISIPTTAPKANQSATTATGTENPADKAKSDALKEVLWQFFLTLIYGGLGFYLIRNGNHLFAILNREDFFEKREETLSASSEKEEYKTPIFDEPLNVTNRKEEVTSLNLTEYVPLSQRIKEAETEKNIPKEAVETETAVSETAEIENSVSEEFLPLENSNSEFEKSAAISEKEPIAPLEIQQQKIAEESDEDIKV